MLCSLYELAQSIRLHNFVKRAEHLYINTRDRRRCTHSWIIHELIRWNVQTHDTRKLTLNYRVNQEREANWLATKPGTTKMDSRRDWQRNRRAKVNRERKRKGPGEQRVSGFMERLERNMESQRRTARIIQLVTEEFTCRRNYRWSRNINAMIWHLLETSFFSWKNTIIDETEE